MVEALTRQAVLPPSLLAQGPRDRAVLRLLPPASQFILRGDDSVCRLVAPALGIASLPGTCRATQDGNSDGAALWLGPDERLLLGPEHRQSSIIAEIAAALGDAPYSLVAVGHRNVAMELTGTASSLVLNAGCPLDLHETAFPVGMCTRTVLARAQIVLWRTGPERFYLNVWRSFLPYVWEFLVEARTRL